MRVLKCGDGFGSSGEPRISLFCTLIYGFCPLLFSSSLYSLTQARRHSHLSTVCTSAEKVHLLVRKCHVDSGKMPTRRVKAGERRRCAKACRSCKHRKERCDGSRPCGRCVQRGVSANCSFDASSQQLMTSPLASPDRSSRDHNATEQGYTPNHSSAFSFSGESTTPVAPIARLIQDGRGLFMFIGDAANLSFLGVVRRIVSDLLGSCQFASDPLRHFLVEEIPGRGANWLVEMVQRPPQRPEPDDARYLALWYRRATSCVLDSFDETELSGSLSQWLDGARDVFEPEGMSAVFFLIFAIGAQSCPEDRDDIAERYFNYGRFLTVSNIMESPNIATIRANVLITIYLLAASRRNAAYMYLGTAVRAAYALGIHRNDINAHFDASEYAVRERLWKVLRMLDAFMSTSLGRPLSTTETRDTRADSNYSASNDLCAIFESILTQVYSKRMVSTEVLERISEHHREWARRYTEGLAADDIQPGEYLETDDGKATPNIGLFYLKEAYYWTIMLIARPYLIEHVSLHTSRNTGAGNSGGTATPKSPSGSILAQACVDSAIRTVDLLRGLETAEETPKRLPFVVNSLFVAALVLGLAQFGDLDQSFPLENSLTGAEKLMSILSGNDPIAKRNLYIVQTLHAACRTYREKRAQRSMERHSLLIGGLFGTVHGGAKSQRRPAGRPAASQVQNNPRPSEYAPTPLTDRDEGSSMDYSSTSLDSVAPQSHGYMDVAAGNLDMMPDLNSMIGMDIPISPRTLIFDSFDQSIPLFSAVDTSLLPIGENDIGENMLGTSFN